MNARSCLLRASMILAIIAVAARASDGHSPAELNQGDRITQGDGRCLANGRLDTLSDRRVRPFAGHEQAGDAVDMVRWFKDNTTPIGSKAKAENPDMIERGIFVQTERPEYCNEYDKIVDKAMGSK